MNVLIWNEFIHEKKDEKVAKIYPDGIHNAIAAFLKNDDISVSTAALEDEECGLSKEVLDKTDVLIWWAHMAHDAVPDELAMRVRDAVLEGMGIIFLHSAHHSKPFKFLMGTSCNLGWREDGDRERIWVVNPAHPIVQGVERCFDLPAEETYSEPFGIPEPDELIMIGTYEGSEVFRSGCCFNRGNGKVFYFQPGHESYPTYYDKNVQLIIKNAVNWAKPVRRTPLECPKINKTAW